jgi:hypothetical protein
MRRGLARLLVSAGVLAATGAGCSLVVSGDVPAFTCASADPSACPPGMTCDLGAGQCVGAEASVEPPEAGEDDATGDAGAAETGVDADAGPLALGSQCRVDSECMSKLCGSSTILTTTITQTTGPICTTTCCNSTECAPSFVCFNGGTGGGYCVPASLAQRQPPATGGKGGGATCNTNSDCRSGLCTDTPKRCLDTCCVNAQCGAGSECRLKLVSAPAPSHDVWVCAATEPGATKNYGDTCAAQAECKSDTCIPSSGGYCRPPCSGHASCAAIPGFTTGLCRYGPSGNDFFKSCQKTTPAGFPNGQACDTDVECQYDYCDPELKKCANICSTNADCTTSEVCRPSATGTPFLRCVKKP